MARKEEDDDDLVRQLHGAADTLAPSLREMFYGRLTPERSLTYNATMQLVALLRKATKVLEDS